ncbi:hypothetical protein MNBD_GAMMA12-2253, partial [hydrothermal vent metagenome]
DGIAQELGKSNFNSIVAFGVDGEDAPRIVLTITNGKIISVGGYNNELLNWDLRASLDEWGLLVTKPPGLMKLGLAYTSRKLKFKKGDYAAMIKDPSLSTAFVKCFSLMGKALT